MGDAGHPRNAMRQLERKIVNSRVQPELLTSTIYKPDEVFGRDSHFERHIRRMRTLYERRRKALVDALSHYLPNLVSILGDNAGMHLMARLATDLSDTELVARAARSGIELVSAQGSYLRSGRRGEFIFGYSNLSERQIYDGIRRLSAML